MKKSIVCALFFALLLLACNEQTKTEAKTLYNKDFKWTITIPENFTNVNPREWTRMQNDGIDAIEDTYEEEVINQSELIFVFKNGDLNYLESNHQPFDVAIDGDYLESCKAVNEIIYGTFEAQMPGAKIDSISSVEEIGDLDFQTFKMKIDYPNGLSLHSLMYSRLFDTKEFSVNIVYEDEIQGRKMLEAWASSIFE